MTRPFYQRKRFWSAIFLTLLFVALFFWRHETADLLHRINWESIRASIQNTGPWAPLICILLIALFTILFLPTTLIVVIVALLYGVFKGAIICLTGFALGMSIAFALARTLLHDWCVRRIGHTRLYLAINENLHSDGWKLILFTRILPINPYPLLNYAYGLTSIRFLPFLFFSTLGLVPNLCAFLWTAHSAGQLAAGKLDWRVVIPLACAAFFFAALAFLPRLLRKRLPFPLPAENPAEAIDPSRTGEQRP